MKTLLSLILFFSYFNLFAQSQHINLIIDERVQIEKVEGSIGTTFEFSLPIVKRGNTDYYSFIISVEGSKAFEEYGINFKSSNEKLITIDKLTKMSPCRVHNLLSSGQIVFLKKAGNSEEYKSWFAFYTGTVRNTLVSRQRTRI